MIEYFLLDFHCAHHLFGLQRVGNDLIESYSINEMRYVSFLFIGSKFRKKVITKR